MRDSTIVILHGWGLSKERFAPLSEALSREKFSVIALDFPGFGDADPPRNPMTVTDYAVFLRNQLKQRGVVHPIFIGHSFGGRVALRFTTLFPSEVHALVLTGTPGFTPTPRKKLVFLICLAKVGKAVFSLPVLSSFFETVRSWYYFRAGAKEFSRANGVMKETFKLVVADPLVDDMKSIRIPCLLVWGALDMIVPVSIAKKMKECISGAELIVLPDTDHGVPFKQPTLFVNAIRAFISK
jgi:pimeloyl-ACP methyl ester carboxylesterase